MVISSVPHWTSGVARAGYTAKGAVYATVGILAGLAAIGAGGKTTGSKGAIQEIGQQPLGNILLILLLIGLACYAIWQFLSALIDAERKGSDTKGMAARCGDLASGIVHLSLAIATFDLLTIGTGGSGERDAKDWTARLLDAPFGPWLVLGVGVTVGFAGFVQWRRAISGSYRKNFSLDGAATSQSHWIERVSKVGLFARGLVFFVIAWFLGRAGLQADPSEARGLGGALDALARQPYGAWLLGLTALGLLCFGLYCWVIARYGTFPATAARR